MSVHYIAQDPTSLTSVVGAPLTDELIVLGFPRLFFLLLLSANANNFVLILLAAVH